jgi:hypothetical protein
VHVRRPLPWRIDRPDSHRIEQNIAADRMLRLVVYAYLVSVGVAGFTTFIGLHESLR